MVSTDNVKGPFNRVRVLLDICVSISMIVACGFVVWSFARPGRSVTVAAPVAQAATNRSRTPLPKEPLPLAGAYIEGDPRAPLAIIEYSDFQCPFCGRFARETLPQLREQYIRTGKVLLAFRHLPLTTIHKFALKAATTSECSAQQNKFWPMHDLLFDNQKQLDDTSLTNLARRIGLDPSKLDRCMSGDVDARVTKDIESARRLGITGTPTFFVGRVKPDGNVQISRVLTGAQSQEQFASALSGDAVVTEDLHH